jgi:hypothetical protein
MTGMTAAVNAARHAAEQAVISSLADTVSRGVVGLSINIDRYTQGCYYPAFSRTGGPKLPGALVIATAVGTGIVPIGASVLSVRPTRKLSGGTHS